MKLDNGNSSVNEQERKNLFWQIYLCAPWQITEEELDAQRGILGVDSFSDINIGLLLISLEKTVDQLSGEPWGQFRTRFGLLVKKQFEMVSSGYLASVWVDANRLILVAEGLRQRSAIAFGQNVLEWLGDEGWNACIVYSLDGTFLESYVTFHEMLSVCNDNIEDNRTIVNILGYTYKHVEYSLPIFKNWEDLLKGHQGEKLYRSIERELLKARREGRLNHRYLSTYANDFTLSMNIFLRNFHMTVFDVIELEGYTEYRLHAESSLEGLLLYIHFIIEHVIDLSDKGKEKDSSVKIVRDYIDAHFSETITHEEITDLVYISGDYLARMFKKEMGMTINEYITMQRINHAMELLKFNDLSIQEISDHVGYDSYNYFARVFKKNTGISPREFRRINKNH